jgi:hypothetical protein
VRPLRGEATAADLLTLPVRLRPAALRFCVPRSCIRAIRVQHWRRRPHAAPRCVRTRQVPALLERWLDHQLKCARQFSLAEQQVTLLDMGKPQTVSLAFAN